MGKEVTATFEVPSWGDIVDGIASLIRPIFQFIAEVSASGWIGFSIVFMIFFMLYLLRIGAKTNNIKIYTDGMRYIGKNGLIVTLLYLVVLSIEHLIFPPIVIFVHLLYNSIFGNEPGISEFITFIEGSSPYRKLLITDLLAIYFSDRNHILPLGLRSTGLVTAAFSSMLIVATAVSAGMKAKPEDDPRNSE